MSTVTPFPGHEPPKKAAEHEDEELEPDASSEAELAIARLIAFYENFSSLPFENFDAKSLGAVLSAIDEDRHQDALDLIDMVIEGIDLSGTDCDALESPIPHIAQFARFGAPVSRPVRPHLHVVGEVYPVQILEHAVSLKSALVQDWIARCGELSFNPEGKSRLELGLKGELVLVLFSGEVELRPPGGEPVTLSCGEGQYAVLHLVYSRARDESGPFVLELASSPDRAARGLWCNSFMQALSELERGGDPDSDVLFARHFHAIEAATLPDGKFCARAYPLPPEGYTHRDGVERGELSLFGFDAGGFSASNGWAFHGGPDSTNVRGMQPGPTPAVAPPSDAGRSLIVHPGIELLVAIDGVTWVAVNQDKPQTDSGGYLSLNAAGTQHPPVFVTPLVAPEDGGHDAMLLDPSYRHCAWMVPDSSARFLHVCFSDPREIKPAKVAGKRQEVAKAAPKPSSMAGR